VAGPISDPIRFARPNRSMAASVGEGYSHRTVTAGDVYRALWRHKFFIVVLTAACVAAAWYVTSRQTQMYEASSLVRVQERGPLAGTASAALQASQDLAQTYAKIIGSGALNDDIRALVLRCTSQRSAAATPPTGGSGQGNSARARQVARVRSCAWLTGPNRKLGRPRKIAEVKLSGEPIEELSLLTLRARSETPRNAVLVADAAPSALRIFIRKTGPRSEQIITLKAATASSPVSRHLPLNIAIAVMLGLIFNGALALVLELFRDRLPEPDEMEQALGHPVLATVPTLRLHGLPANARTAEGPSAIGRTATAETARPTAGSRAGPEREG
jgi:capsular polysaccharide biosynthesis protein